MLVYACYTCKTRKEVYAVRKSGNNKCACGRTMKRMTYEKFVSNILNSPTEKQEPMYNNNLRLFAELKAGDSFHFYASTAPLVKIDINTYRDIVGNRYAIRPHTLVFLFTNPATIRKE